MSSMVNNVNHVTANINNLSDTQKNAARLAYNQLVEVIDTLHLTRAEHKQLQNITGALNPFFRKNNKVKDI
jgi:hypothetical protein